MLAEQIKAIQANIERIHARGIDVPVADVMLFRTLVMLGRSLAQLADEGLQTSGLAEPEFRVLMAIYGLPEGVGHPGELCAGAGQSPANMSRITDTLFELGLITREPSAQDRRRMILRLTEKGSELARVAAPAAFAPVRALFAALPAASRRQMLASLGELVAAFDSHAPTALQAPVTVVPPGRDLP